VATKCHRARKSGRSFPLVNGKPTASHPQVAPLAPRLALGRDSAALGAWLGCFSVGNEPRGLFIERDARPGLVCDVFLAGAAREAA